MNKRLAPHFIELTQNACLKAFWRKKALRLFLQQHHIMESFLATWSSEESKRDFLFRLFDKLVNQTNSKGHSVILIIAHSLVDMKHFPDLENYEDSSQKIKAAKEAIIRLTVVIDSIDGKIQDEKEIRKRKADARERREKDIASRVTLDKLEQALNGLVKVQGTQKGGYEYEKWFYDLALYFEIDSRPPYNAGGRQIDGAITIEGTTFLIETKFKKVKIGSPDIDVFMSKVESKSDNTMGIFISMSGFSDGAIMTASRIRTPILLMDYSHIYNLILQGTMTLPELVKRIKRHASQTGKAYLMVDKFSS